MSNIKNTVEQNRSLEIDEENCCLKSKNYNKMADAKSKALECEINMLREEVKELRLLLNGEGTEDNLNCKKENCKNHTETHNFSLPRC